MWTDHDAAVAAAYRVDARRWRELFDELMVTVGVRFRRPEPRRRVRDFVRGLLAPLPRKNCWTIAEHAGDASPDGMQDLLARAQWDDGQGRADVRGFIAGQLGDPDAVLIVDETGDLKKGRHTPRGPAPVLGHGREDRELPARGASGLCHRGRARAG